MTVDPRVRLSDLARKAGIRGAFMFPVVYEGRQIGVIAFSSRRAREPDDRLLQAARVIGSQIGQFLARQILEPHAVSFASESVGGGCAFGCTAA